MNDFLNWLLNPPARITNPEKIQRTRLLSAILLVLLLVGTTILIIVIRHDANDINEPEVRGAAIVMVIIAAMYLINRTGYNRYAAGGVIFPFAAIFTYIAFLSSGKAIFLAFVLVPILMTAIFFPLKWTALISGSILAIILALLSTLDQVSKESPFWNLRNMWFFLLIATSLILTFFWHLQNLERLRAQELKQVNEQLEQKFAELERFTYTVSHELKNPIVTIKGFLGSVEKDINHGNYEKALKDFPRITKATAYLHSTITDLLELSQIGRVVSPPEKVSLTELVQEVLDAVDNILRSRNANVKVASNLPVIYGDRKRLREVYENLIINASKYTGDQNDPMIEIGFRDGQEKVLFVKDNGAGIDPKFQARIFGLFDKLDPTSEGTGIGLAIVKRIVETHDGRIWVESDGLGKGSIFCFTIPMSGAAFREEGLDLNFRS
jgi:signal transduction histidine kinase